MAMGIYTSAAFTTGSGLAVAGSASVEVRNEATGALAAIYTDRNGTTPASNPLTADSSGRFSFFALGGAYKVTVTKGAESQVLRYQAIGTAAEIDAESVLNNRNDIINGKFRIAQAGTSFADPANGAYDLDGWRYGRTTSGLVTVSRENDVITSPAGNFYRRLLVTTADTSIAASDVVRSFTNIEGYEALKYVGNTFTIGFRVRATVTGVHCIAIKTNTKTYVEEYTISATHTWEYKTITVVGGLENDLASITNASAVTIRWVHACGSNHHTTAGTWQAGDLYATSNQVNDMSAINNVFDLTDVSINLGSSVSVALTSHEDELRRCQRYFVTGETRSVGYASGANQSLFFSVDYPVAMLYSPTVTTSVGTTTNTGTTYTALTSSATRFSGNVLSSGSGNTAATLSFSASARL